jgi:hypothetical protein
MPTSYTLQAGESLGSIADRFGLLDWKVIYDSPLNLALRTKRKDPKLVQPGDTFWIPDRTASNTSPVEFQLNITDSVKGGLVPGVTLELEVPDGPNRKKITRDAGSLGRLLVKNPDLTKGDVAILSMVDKSEPVPIRYGVEKTWAKLPTGRPNPISLVDRRRVAREVAVAHKIHRRWDWGKRTPNYSIMEYDWDYTIVAIHHSGNNGEKDPVEIETKHMVTRKWDDVGYHYLIPPNGEIYEGRYLAFKGSHVEKANTGKVGILIMGDFEHQAWDFDDDPTSAQLDSAAKLINTLKGHFALDKLGGHKDYKAGTECPGGELYKKLPDLRKKTGLGGP